MVELDKGRLIGELARRHAIRIDDNDPAIAIVALNCLMLEHAVEELSESVAKRIGEFERSVLKVEQRAGKLLALELSEAAARIRAELRNDIDAAGVKAARLVYLVDQAHKRPARARWWLSVGLVAAVALFAAGIWIGTHWFAL
jgi:type IV pilus biogenesis protein CpaD/CtpE